MISNGYLPFFSFAFKIIIFFFISILEKISMFSIIMIMGVMGEWMNINSIDSIDNIVNQYLNLNNFSSFVAGKITLFNLFIYFFVADIIFFLFERMWSGVFSLSLSFIFIEKNILCNEFWKNILPIIIINDDDDDQHKLNDWKEKPNQPAKQLNDENCNRFLQSLVTATHTMYQCKRISITATTTGKVTNKTL